MSESKSVFLGLAEKSMKKKYIVGFTGHERKIRDDTMDKLKGSSQKPRPGKDSASS